MNFPGAGLHDLAFIIGALLILLAVVRAGRRRAGWDLGDIITGDNGKVSESKTGMAVCMYVTTWGFVHLTMKDMLSEWYFAAYMLAWAGVSLGNKALSRDQVTTSTTEKVVSTTTHAKPASVPTPAVVAPTSMGNDAHIERKADEIQVAAEAIKDAMQPDAEELERAAAKKP